MVACLGFASHFLLSNSLFASCDPAACQRLRYSLSPPDGVARFDRWELAGLRGGEPFLVSAIVWGGGWASLPARPWQANVPNIFLKL